MPHNNRCFHWWFSVLQVSSIFTAVFSSVTGPVYVLKYVGEDAKFTWTTDGQPFKSIQFGISNAAKTDVTAPALFTSNLNRVVLSGPNTTDPVYQGRLHFYGNVSSGHATFEIKNIRVSDEHTYLVMIKEKGAPSEQKYNVIRMGTLTIRVAPTFASQLNSPHDITEGQDLSITCSADGVPTPNITWIWNDSVKDHGTGNATLSITGITRDKKGIYECQAINDPAKSPIKIQTTVNVQYNATIDKDRSSSREPGWINHTAVLTCATDGNPVPEVTWYNENNKQVYKNTTLISNYTFMVKADEDFGNYTCKAKNKLGAEVIHVITLYQSKKPPPITPPVDTPTSASPRTGDGTNAGIIAGAVVAGLLAVAGVIVAVIYCRRKKQRLGAEPRKPRHEERIELEEEYATPHRGAHDNRDSAAEQLPQYAAVDRSKKTKKPPPTGGLIYADLDFNDENAREGRAASQRRSTGPQAETEYAVVSGTQFNPEPQYGNIGSRAYTNTEEM